METIGVFADMPTASTGMAVVCNNLALQLAKHPDLRVVYFGRYGWNKAGFAPEEETKLIKDYVYVPTEGGVWKANTVKNAIETYKITKVLSEDDWFSAQGLVESTKLCKVPLHYISPIDSLPIHPNAFEMFNQCTKVYVPNSSYSKIPNGVYLPHGVNSVMFQPLTKTQKRMFDKFTILMIGRMEERKALGRGILAFKNICEKYDNAQMVIRTDWGTERGVKTALYLSRHKEIPIIRDQMKDVEHGYLQYVYANADMMVIPSKAGGFEMCSIESQACGAPVLVTDWTFMNETVVDGKSGFLIPISETCREPQNYGRIWGNISIDALSNKMAWCIDNQKAIKSMGIWARNHVIDNYNWEKITDTLCKEMEV